MYEDCVKRQDTMYIHVYWCGSMPFSSGIPVLLDARVKIYQPLHITTYKTFIAINYKVYLKIMPDLGRKFKCLKELSTDFIFKA